MQTIPDITELWIHFGTGRSYRHIPAHQIAQSLGADKAAGLLFFHAFTGCDTVSGFHGSSKPSAWDA